MNLERFIYEFNLASTMAVENNVEWGYVLNNEINKEIDYENSISFYNLVESFNKLYLRFKNDYAKLDNWNLGEYIEILDVYSNEKSGNLYRSLVIYIGNPNKEICEYDETLLYLCEENGKLTGRITNNLNFFDKDYYNKEILIDENMVRNYLDFFLKYKSFIETFNFFSNINIFGNGTTMIFSKIDGNLFDNISKFELAFGNAFFNYEDYINVVFKLGDKLIINYDDCLVKLQSSYIENNKEIIDTLIHSLYLNRCKLPKCYTNDKIRKLEK